ncbi:MAG: winged helix-turn-helix transcriptional regulator [Leptolyngbyaceae cyanobacterium RU_5_1]|nr:winged helix-turn-helix transcriptional regulator [Leptolyngbyaceae cyanobacterium RU_5_1]
MSTDQLSLTFNALADPTRRAILAHLAQGEASVTELAKPFQGHRGNAANAKD